jgi:hypothetical protein
MYKSVNTYCKSHVHDVLSVKHMFSEQGLSNSNISNTEAGQWLQTKQVWPSEHIFALSEKTKMVYLVVMWKSNKAAVLKKACAETMCVSVCVNLAQVCGDQERRQ